MRLLLISLGTFLLFPWLIGGQDVTKDTTESAKSLVANQTKVLQTSTIENLLANDDEDYEDYEDDENDNEDQEGIDVEPDKDKNNGRRRHKKIKQHLGITYMWGQWDKWSRCGSGCVQSRKRSCIKRTQNSTDSEPVETIFYPDPKLANTTGCLGIMKKYRLCNADKCPTANGLQMRHEQCSQFNRIIIRGRYYQWEAYEDPYNECELHCKVKDSDIIMNMNKSVIDGTPCRKPAIHYTHYYRRKAVCVEGICKAVHAATGAIRPSTTKDSRERCGSVLCQRVNEIFTQSKLTHGYNYITTIPTGAMNLTIKQVAKSNNLIALKTKEDKYIVNGNNRPSEGGFFEYNDDIFDYNKEASVIKAKGPLNNPIVLMLLVSELNPGVQYSYVLPVPSASISEPEEMQSQWNELGQPLDEIDETPIKENLITKPKEKRKRKYAWELLGFGPCSRTCGPGKQSPIFRCTRESESKETVKRYYSPKRCANIEKETFLPTIYMCSHGLCPAYWKKGEFGECDCSNGTAEGFKTRDVLCYQENINATHVQVDETKCKETKPAAKEKCPCKKPKIYTRNVEKATQMYNRYISSSNNFKPFMNKRHTNANSSSNTTTLKRYNREEKHGVWLMSEWNQQCSKDCLYNYEHRTTYCDRTAPYVDPCDPVLQPENRRSCTSRSKTCRRGLWFASEWSKCSGDCLNRRRTRMVLCVMDGYVVDKKQCDPKTKPTEVTICATKDSGFCGPKWHYSEWSECSRTCGEGVQRRYAKCLEFDYKLKEMTESNKCKFLEREPVYGTCNLGNCEELRAAQYAAGGGRIVDNNAITVYTRGGGGAGGAAAVGEDGEAVTESVYDDYDDGVNGDVGELGYVGVATAAEPDDSIEESYQDLSASSSSGNEKLVIASAPKVLQNCREELNNCKRINRERLCKVDYYKKNCCLTCHGFY
ncbi:thrombospondin type-1 domain-containing protein 4-like [Musca autumnalis]|uniref:thrombospondin type-1 domain-containing protein 4-like n=1 Tax=Musca autumnalis TaxID=221902 RepID=UPI003CE97D5A